MTEIATPDKTAKHLRIMAQGSPCPVRIVSEKGKESRGVVRLQSWNRQERFRRAARTWGMLWGMAVVSVLIPLAHFLLVPSFLIAGPIVAFTVFGKESAVLGGEGTCPECGEFLPIVGGSPEWPLRDLCSKCQNSLKVSALDA